MRRTDHWKGGDPADRLDDDLDRMVRGGRPESGAERSGFGPTIEHLYQLASDARVTVQLPARQRPSAAKHAPLPTIPIISRRTIMSGFSAAAVLALMLTIAFNAFPLAGSTDHPETQLAAINQGSPAATQPDDCTFPASDQFTTANPAVPERSPGMQPRSIVFRDTLNARAIETEVLQIADGRMDNPADPLQVGWYEQSAAPSEGGNVVMTGYVDDRDSGPAALVQLGSLDAGDEVHVNTASGLAYVYIVEWTKNYELEAVTEADSAEVLGPTTEPSLTLITCGGEFDYEIGQYLSRTVVRATLQTNQSEATPDAVGPTGNLEVDPPRPLTREDCNVEPRTREEVIEILGTLPAPVGPGNLTDVQLPLDQATLPQLQDTVHDFQACRLFGMTYHWAAMLSEDELRRMVYENGQTTPYSAAVLDEIVRGWEEIDAAHAAQAPAGEALAFPCAVVLSPDLPSEGATYVTDTAISMPAVLTAGEAGVVETVPGVFTVHFVREDGRWQIDSFPERYRCA